MSYYYTYILYSLIDKKFYTGYTSDLRKRYNEHEDGKVRSTEHRRPLVLVYYEACTTEEDARACERYLKSGMGKRYLRNRLKNFLSNL